MPGQRSSRSHPVAATLTVMIALICVVLLIAHPMLPDSGGLLSMVETFLPWLGVVIAVLGVAALVARSKSAISVVTVAAVVWAVQFVPTALPAQLGEASGQTRAAGATPGGDAFTIITENVHASNSSIDSLVEDLLSREPDVIVLQEVDAASLDVVDAVLSSDYPERFVVGTVGVWSSVPLSDGERLDLGLGWNRALAVDVETPSGALRLFAVHLASFRPGEYEDRDRMLAELTASVAADSSDRLVVVGDFNTASTDSKLSGLLDEAPEARETSIGFGFTWPSAFPIARLDHTLVRGDVDAVSTVLEPNGSDHRGVLLTIR